MFWLNCLHGTVVPSPATRPPSSPPWHGRNAIMASFPSLFEFKLSWTHNDLDASTYNLTSQIDKTLHGFLTLSAVFPHVDGNSPPTLDGLPPIFQLRNASSSSAAYIQKTRRTTPTKEDGAWRTSTLPGANVGDIPTGGILDMDQSGLLEVARRCLPDKLTTRKMAASNGGGPRRRPNSQPTWHTRQGLQYVVY